MLARNWGLWMIAAACAAALVTACGGGGGGGSSLPASPALPAPPAPTTPPAAEAPSAAEPTRSFSFETGPVRPLALSADGSRLYVANTVAGTLEIVAVEGATPRVLATVAVGLEPVAVAVRHSGEVWVVNHLSDSVSVVDVAASPPRVVKTLLVGDEPRDIVFAGANRQRAFITTARRGQQRSQEALAGVPGAGDPQLTSAGTGRADVWVFDANQLGDGSAGASGSSSAGSGATPGVLGGKPLAILTFRGDTPRALAVTPDGKTVYAAVHQSGNRSTVISALLPCEGFDVDTPCTVGGVAVPGSALGPPTNHAGEKAPRVGLIVKGDGNGSWRDGRGRDWKGVVRFDLPDEDVFSVDADTLVPGARYAQVGTTLFNMVVNPASGVVYVSNNESRNELRFEGPGRFAGSTLQGQLAHTRVTVLRPGVTGTAAAVAPRHLNKHLDYRVRPAPAAAKAHSLSMPLDMAITANGATLYVAAFGSAKVGVFPTAALEDNSFDPTQLSSGYITLSAGGPSGLALDETRGRLYVATRFDNGVSVVDIATRRETVHLRLANPESAAIRDGRKFLYDANLSSSNGEASCASCHTFGNTDHLAWDLGDPDANVVQTPINIKLEVGALVPPFNTTINGSGRTKALHPMKGPMSTQTLRGLANHGAMHWRGDRVDGFFGKDTRSSAPFDSELAFKNFIVAFDGLLGRAAPLPVADMQAFTQFALALVTPPNPVRALDNSLNTAQARGRRYFMGCDGLDSLSGVAAVCGADGRPVGAGHFSDGLSITGVGFTCEGCHTLNPAQGFFGTDGQFSFEALPQTVKIPHLRNMYEKVGMFGNAPTSAENAGDNAHKGAQVRGYGFAHDGSIDSLFRFFQGRVFNSAQGGRIGFAGGDNQRRDVEAFMLAFDNDVAPIVGQQVTLDGSNASVVGARIDLLRSRALAPFASKMMGNTATECELVARGVVNGRATVFVLKADGSYARDDGAAATSESGLRELARQAGQAITYTCMPTGWAPRL